MSGCGSGAASHCRTCGSPDRPTTAACYRATIGICWPGCCCCRFWSYYPLQQEQQPPHAAATARYRAAGSGCGTPSWLPGAAGSAHSSTGPCARSRHSRFGGSHAARTRPGPGAAASGEIGFREAPVSCAATSSSLRLAGLHVSTLVDKLSNLKRATSARLQYNRSNRDGLPKGREDKSPTPVRARRRSSCQCTTESRLMPRLAHAARCLLKHPVRKIRYAPAAACAWRQCHRPEEGRTPAADGSAQGWS